MPAVRLANSNDEDELVAYAKRMDGQWGLTFADGTPFPFSEDRARQFIRDGLCQKDAWIAVIGESGDIQASACLCVAKAFYSEQPYLAERWLNVLPEYRSSGHARALIEFCKSFASAIDLPFIIGVLSQERTEAKGRLYDIMLGQKATGQFYVYHHQNDAKASAEAA